MKLNLDKYYTPVNIAEYCVKKTNEIIGNNNISGFIEPSAGCGVFLPFLDKPYFAFDIEPAVSGIDKNDFLKLDLLYSKGKCVIGNPPFGTRNTLSVKFYKKSIHICDYISFILPISQYNNNQQMYEFDLIYSEMLPVAEYSGVKLHCCFNIYERPKKGLNKSPINYILKDVTVLEYRRGGIYKIPIKYDFGMCSWGSIGKEIKYSGEYAQESYVLINNENFKEQILDIMRKTDWKNLYPCISTPKIQTWKIYKYLKEQIPQLV